MQKIRVNDEVQVIAGKDKGKVGKVSKLFLKQNRVLVTGVNIQKKTQRASQENPAGGIFDKEATLHISNVMVVSPKTKKPTRVRVERKDGKAIRVAVSCGSELS